MKYLNFCFESNANLLNIDFHTNSLMQIYNRHWAFPKEDSRKISMDQMIDIDVATTLI